MRTTTGLRERLWDDVADAALRARRWIQGRAGRQHAHELSLEAGEFLLAGSDFTEFASE